MGLGIGIVVFFVSLITLVAEFILYFILGIGAAFTTNSTSTISGLAFFFVGLMIFTGAVGILFPICAILATVTKNKRLGNIVFLASLALILVGYFWMISIATHKNAPEKSGTSRPSITTTAAKFESQTALADKETTLAISKDSIEKEYIKNSLVLKDLKVGTGYGQFDVPGYSAPKKGVFGSIKNIGDKSIGLLEITVYFLDSKGLRVGEKSYTLIATNNMFNKTQPMKPNYSKDIGYVLEGDAPSEWAGKIEVEISKIEFEKE